MDSINVKSLYRIVNRAIGKIDKCSDEPVNKEMHLFKERYSHYITQNPYHSLFEERCPLIEEVAFSLDFCDALYDYQQIMNVDADRAIPLSEKDYRILLKGIEMYKDHISPENIQALKIIENNAKRKLPEFREQYLMEEYYREALFVIEQRKNYQKARKNKQPRTKDYEKYALHFYERITEDEEMKRIGVHTKKLELYEITLEIVDCLPQEKYKRSAKFKIKSQLWFAIAKSLYALNKTKVAEIKRARNEAVRYARAAENALSYTPNFKIATSIRNKRQEFEWLYH